VTKEPVFPKGKPFNESRFGIGTGIEIGIECCWFKYIAGSGVLWFLPRLSNMIICNPILSCAARSGILRAANRSFELESAKENSNDPSNKKINWH
jgi:hypothetical protein